MKAQLTNICKRKLKQYLEGMYSIEHIYKKTKDLKLINVSTLETRKRNEY